MINPFILETHKDRLVNDAFINFRFIENGHLYTSREKKIYVSITTILKDMGISPNYDIVDKKKVEDAVVYGEMIHKEIENYCKFNESSFIQELDFFKEWEYKNKIRFVASEYRVHNDNVAGTIDLIYCENGKLVISDIKTTNVVHKECVSWQLSLYRYLLGENIEKATCIHIRPNLYEVVEIPLKSNEECMKLLEAYNTNTKYEVELIEQKQVDNLVNLQNELEALKKAQEKIENRIQAFKDYCLQEMSVRGLLKVEVESGDKKISIVKVEPKDKETINIEKLKKEHPEINYQEYTKTTKVKPYIKISG